MGAADFRELVRNSNVDEAFRMALSEARHEFGHGGYTGSIAEKGTYHNVDTPTRTLQAAHAYADAAMGSRETSVGRYANDKWGPAVAIPVCMREEERVDFSVTVPVDPTKEPTRKQWEELLRAEDRLKPQDVITGLWVDKTDDRTRIEMKRTEGKAVIRYFYADPRIPGARRGPEKGDPNNWLSGFLTMAEWRKHAKALAEKHGGTYHCMGITRRFDDEPLDVVDAIVTKRKVTLRVNAVRPPSGKLTTDAWLFFGMASH